MRALLVHRHDTEVDDIEAPAIRRKSHADRALESAGVQARRGTVFLAAIDGEFLDRAVANIDPQDLEPYRRKDLPGCRRLINELGDERLALEAEGLAPGEVDSIGRGVNAEEGNRRGRHSRLLLQDGLRLLFSRRVEVVTFIEA